MKRRHLPLALLALLVLPTAAPAAAEATEEGALHGIDVSHYSGSVDWPAVLAAGIDFVYVKATEGVDARDPMFAQHWETLGELGIPRGAYHFYVTEDDPEAQARFFLDVAAPRPGDLVPVVDVEVLGHGTEPGLPERLRRFLAIVEAEVGAKPMIYTGPNFWNQHLGEGFGEHPLWIAEYGVTSPVVPNGWDGWHLWQWQGDADTPGVEKGADHSRGHPEVSLEALRVPSPAGAAADP